MKILHLTLSEDPFNVMQTGEKTKEFRDDSEWMRSRLLTKNGNRRHYDVVKFTHGYRKNARYFIAKYDGFYYSNTFQRHIYSNGLVVDEMPGMIIINLGEIIEKGNL